MLNGTHQCSSIYSSSTPTTNAPIPPQQGQQVPVQVQATIVKCPGCGVLVNSSGHYCSDYNCWVVTDGHTINGMTVSKSDKLLVECADGKKRTVADKEKWQQAIWDSIQKASGT
jgi:hypothetical protein